MEKKPSKRRGRKNLDDIDEEDSDTESTHPDEWEEEVGVIAGMVANWDPETQMGLCEPEDLVREGMLHPYTVSLKPDPLTLVC